MSNYFILASNAPAFARARISEVCQLSKAEVGAQTQPANGDVVLVVTGRNGNYEWMLNHVFLVSASDRAGITLALDKSYVNSAPIDKVRAVLNRLLSPGLASIQATEYESLISLLGGIRPTEKQLLDHVKRYIAARGYYFDEETVHNYHVCLKTRPFVILAGLSGTGKSKLSQLYAEAMGHNVQNGHYLRLAVRPSWNDDRFLLGYLNTITGEYITEPAVEFVMQAERDRDNLYLFCLDEMNLAHVEYYFSQFLSALEEENPADRVIHLYGKSIQARMAEQGRAVQQDRMVIVPTNLLFTGTINVDETTQPLSDKVIDRANTIEFFEVDLDKLPQPQAPPEAHCISTSTWQSYLAEQPDMSYRQRIIEIGSILNKASLGLGYRVLREVGLYLANSQGLLAPDVAFDLQVKQRILPRVRGTAAIGSMLRELIAYAKQHNLSRSGKRLEEMESRLKRDGYTSFWR